MTIVEPAGLAEFKQRTRATWAAGDFPAVARRTLWEVGQRLVRRVGIGAGEDVLDVACGTGNVAIRAAQAGGRVVGVDLTPELFPAGRELADQAGVRIEWTEGDAEALPVRRRQLRRRAVDLRRHVRPAPRGRGVRTGPRAPPGWPAGTVQLDTRGHPGCPVPDTRRLPAVRAIDLRAAAVGVGHRGSRAAAVRRNRGAAGVRPRHG